jgi:hypothetical protein
MATAWPTRFLDANLDRIAITTLPLVLHPRTWIDRRREYVEFLDEHTLRREVRVDFAVPVQRWPLTTSSDKPMFLAPVALVAKGSLRQLRVDDPNGAEIAPVNRGDAEKVACRLLILVAEATAGGSLAGDLERELRALVVAPPSEKQATLGRLHGLEGDGSTQLARLLTDSRFRILLADLADNFLFLVPVVDLEADQRASVRYVYEEPAPLEKPDWRETLGFNAVDLAFDVPALGSALSCDIDIKAPEELRIESARILRGAAGTAVLAEDPSPSRIAHLRVHDEPRGTRGVVWVGLRLRSGGFLASSVIAAFLTVAVLTLGVVRADAVGRATESAAALLIGLPALLAGYLVRPGEHRLVGRVIGGIRRLLAGLVLLCVVAIGTLIGGMGEDARQVAWGILAGLALLAFGATLATWLRARRLEQ